MSLGRGLGALITPTGTAVSNRLTQKHETGTKSLNNDEGRLWFIPLSEITANPKQPRTDFRPEELSELAASIKEHGILQPLLLAEKNNGGYEIIAGERRFRAAKLAGLTKVPATVRQLSEQKKLEIALIENIQREALNPMEEAFAYHRLIEEFDLTQEKVAEKVGKSRPAIANTIRLLELPDEAQKALIEKRINTGQARALLSLKNAQEQLAALSSMLGQKITVREAERLTQNKKSVTPVRPNPNLAFLEEKLRVALGTKVTINDKGERGTIAIGYYSAEELGRLIKKITGEV